MIFQCAMNSAEWVLSLLIKAIHWLNCVEGWSWKDIARSGVPAVSSIVTVGTSIITVTILLSQRTINSNAYKLNLFDKRYATYIDYIKLYNNLPKNEGGAPIEDADVYDPEKIEFLDKEIEILFGIKGLKHKIYGCDINFNYNIIKLCENNKYINELKWEVGFIKKSIEDFMSASGAIKIIREVLIKNMECAYHIMGYTKEINFNTMKSILSEHIEESEKENTLKFLFDSINYDIDEYLSEEKISHAQETYEKMIKSIKENQEFFENTKKDMEGKLSLPLDPRKK